MTESIATRFAFDVPWRGPLGGVRLFGTSMLPGLPLGLACVCSFKVSEKIGHFSVAQDQFSYAALLAFTGFLFYLLASAITVQLVTLIRLRSDFRPSPRHLAEAPLATRKVLAVAACAWLQSCVMVVADIFGITGAIPAYLVFLPLTIAAMNNVGPLQAVALAGHHVVRHPLRTVMAIAVTEVGLHILALTGQVFAFLPTLALLIASVLCYHFVLALTVDGVLRTASVAGTRALCTTQRAQAVAGP